MRSAYPINYAKLLDLAEVGLHSPSTDPRPILQPFTDDVKAYVKACCGVLRS